MSAPQGWTPAGCLAHLRREFSGPLKEVTFGPLNLSRDEVNPELIHITLNRPDGSLLQIGSALPWEGDLDFTHPEKFSQAVRELSA